MKNINFLSKENALKGRSEPIFTEDTNIVTKENIKRHAMPSEKEIYFAMGCYWGAERRFWNTAGVKVTAVGFAGGYTPNPTYKEVCTGQTGHTEVVKVIFNTNETSLPEVFKVFWESHDPTQGMRQGNDIGTQYRSAIYTVNDDDLETALKSRDDYQKRLTENGFGKITTEVEPLETFYFAETEHQQYLHKNPNGYCGLAGTGISCPIGLT
ncbi:Peptide methionine sulfoxide reductase MsrA [Marinomonas gallaica]|uniref:Peptide methionine sulfoxide reductase MsrA n=1 Tax=Marinomonas gallaica TaxID=1806667 RepID=A0A1C3JVC3_9GAMM|nr:peptide-methionine (S)-S-oxide reductase MsrA [Marinomonas gallaica]SBT19153.1 Peptide methionine sulfoxide reductase MsrA [Marinomonas gallaica]SBT22678.1 Peptide methionine sulfoxide reductase MsrA [Marinomonas gallaica]